MMYNAKEVTLNIQGVLFDYITFGSGKKTLIMIQGLNTRGIKGSATSLAYMYRMFAKDYKVYLFDRRYYGKRYGLGYCCGHGRIGHQKC